MKNEVRRKLAKRSDHTELIFLGGRLVRHHRVPGYVRPADPLPRLWPAHIRRRLNERRVRQRAKDRAMAVLP